MASLMPILLRNIYFDPYAKFSFQQHRVNQLRHIPKQKLLLSRTIDFDLYTFKPVPKRITSYSSSMMIERSCQIDIVNLERTE